LEIFLDTANLDEIKSVLPWGIISGLTTNRKILVTNLHEDFEALHGFVGWRRRCWSVLERVVMRRPALAGILARIPQVEPVRATG